MLQRNISVMGEDLGKQHTALMHEVTALHLYWKEFLELFGTNDKRIDRLNRSAPGFFAMLQEQQFETNMMHIARITDSRQSVGKENLTISNLPDLVDATLQAELTTLVDAAKNKCKFAREWRNRRFAHHDLSLAIKDRKALPLQAATKDNVNAALAAIADVLNAIERHYQQNFCDFGSVMTQTGVWSLLFTLGFGVKARDEMEGKIKSGQFDDLDRPEDI
jgi:hypothetical protein